MYFHGWLRGHSRQRRQLSQAFYGLTWTPTSLASTPAFTRLMPFDVALFSKPTVTAAPRYEPAFFKPSPVIIGHERFALYHHPIHQLCTIISRVTSSAYLRDTKCTQLKWPGESCVYSKLRFTLRHPRSWPLAPIWTLLPHQTIPTDFKFFHLKFSHTDEILGLTFPHAVLNRLKETNKYNLAVLIIQLWAKLSRSLEETIKFYIWLRWHWNPSYYKICQVRQISRSLHSPYVMTWTSVCWFTSPYNALAVAPRHSPNDTNGLVSGLRALLKARALIWNI